MALGIGSTITNRSVSMSATRKRWTASQMKPLGCTSNFSKSPIISLLNLYAKVGRENTAYILLYVIRAEPKTIK